MQENRRLVEPVDMGRRLVIAQLLEEVPQDEPDRLAGVPLPPVLPLHRQPVLEATVATFAAVGIDRPNRVTGTVGDDPAVVVALCPSQGDPFGPAPRCLSRSREGDVIALSCRLAILIPLKESLSIGRFCGAQRHALTLPEAYIHVTSPRPSYDVERRIAANSILLDALFGPQVLVSSQTTSKFLASPIGKNSSESTRCEISTMPRRKSRLRTPVS